MLRRSGIALLLVLSVSMTGCGTRLNRTEIVEAAGAGAVGQPGVGTGRDGTAPPAGAESALEDTGAGAGTGAPVGGGGTPAHASGSTGAAPGAEGDGQSGGSAGAPAAPGAAANPGGGTTAGRPNGVPIVIGSVGSLSGVYGSALKPILDGAQINISDVNRGGGVNGHPIKVLVADDNGDPANHLAILRRMVEQDKVVAFLNLPAASLSKAALNYLESKNVPYVDGDDSNPLAGTSPMSFTRGGAGVALNGGEFGAAAGAFGKGKKIGTLSCQELQQCADYQSTARDFAGRAGLSVVYSGRASVTAPDYTQNCLQARNAGVEVLFLRMDANSIKRISRDCTRQNFRPKYALGAGLPDASFISDRNLDGLVIPSPNFPFFATDTPDNTRFQAAMRRNRPADRIVPSNAQGWNAANILLKAFAGIGPADAPSSAAVLAGLWKFRNETLGGSSLPITYTKGAPPPGAKTSCYIPVVLTAGKYTAPRGTRAVSCLPRE